MSKRLPPAAFLDDPVALARLRKADDPRLERLAGSKEVRVLRETMERLRQETGHGNRLLEAHHVLVLSRCPSGLGSYNPMMRSLRSLELARQNHRVQEVVGLERIGRSTHSDFLAVADPAVLMPVVRALREKLPAATHGRGNEDLDTLLENVVAFDASYFEVPVQVAWAIHTHYPQADSKKKGLSEPGNKTDRPMRKHLAQIRLNLHWATRRGDPLGMSIDGVKGSETDAFIQALEPNMI